jgi:hypothetical protein
MPIKPLKNSTNTWIISYSFTEDGEHKVLTEEFKGTIKEAMSHEKQLRKVSMRSSLPKQ